MHPAQRFDVHAVRRPEWLSDLLSVRPGPLSASTWAWKHRWLPLPVRFENVLALGTQFELSDGELLHLTHAAARRIHFAFALETLGVFVQEALRCFPDDDLLRVLLHAAAVSDSGDALLWSALEECVSNSSCDGIADHVLLTAVYLSSDTPGDVLERCLALAERLAAQGDLIALYRTVSILRRLGRYEASLQAGAQVNDELISGRYAAALCEHLSERVLNERHLVVELLSIDSARRSEDPRGRPDTGL
jgi:hypothetical protein